MFRCLQRKDTSANKEFLQIFVKQTQYVHPKKPPFGYKKVEGKRA